MSSEIIRYNAGDMPEKKQIDVNFPVPFLEQIEEWAEKAYMSRNQFIISSLLEGAPILAEKLNLKEKNVTMKEPVEIR